MNDAIDAAVRGRWVDAAAALDAGLPVHAAHTLSGNTLLHQAAYSGHGDVLLRLLGLGADPNARNVQARTPAHFAAVRGCVPELSALIAAGAVRALGPPQDARPPRPPHPPAPLHSPVLQRDRHCFVPCACGAGAGLGGMVAHTAVQTATVVTVACGSCACGKGTLVSSNGHSQHELW